MELKVDFYKILIPSFHFNLMMNSLTIKSSQVSLFLSHITPIT